MIFYESGLTALEPRIVRLCVRWVIHQPIICTTGLAMVLLRNVSVSVESRLDQCQ